MSIYQGSRYTKTTAYSRDGNLVFKSRKRTNFSKDNCTEYIYSAGDRLDILATKFYGDSQLWWVFLEINTQYRSELDIEFGDVLLIPVYEEVMKVYV